MNQPPPACPPCPVQIVILVGALLAALFLVLLQLPVPGASALMPLLGAAWAASLPLALLAQAVSALPPLPETAERLLPDSTRELDEERRDAIWWGPRRALLPPSGPWQPRLSLRSCDVHSGSRQAACLPLVCFPRPLTAATQSAS